MKCEVILTEGVTWRKTFNSNYEELLTAILINSWLSCHVELKICVWQMREKSQHPGSWNHLKTISETDWWLHMLTNPQTKHSLRISRNRTIRQSPADDTSVPVWTLVSKINELFWWPKTKGYFCWLDLAIHALLILFIQRDLANASSQVYLWLSIQDCSHWHASEESVHCIIASVNYIGVEGHHSNWQDKWDRAYALLVALVQSYCTIYTMWSRSKLLGLLRDCKSWFCLTPTSMEMDTFS